MKFHILTNEERDALVVIYEQLMNKCDDEFDKYVNRKKNCYLYISKEITKIRKMLGFLAKDMCQNTLKNPLERRHHKTDCRICSDCPFSLVSLYKGVKDERDNVYGILSYIKHTCH